MRGKPATGGAKVGSERNIPAYAGKTVGLYLQPDAFKEHPRVCGENSRASMVMDSNLGTSPRMRGKLAGEAQRRTNQGNIPAYAGKTLLGCQSPPAHQEHPRVCGENRTNTVD